MKTILTTLCTGLFCTFTWVSCCQPQEDPRPSASAPDFRYEVGQLRQTAILLGCSRERAEKLSLENLVTEISGRVQNSRRIGYEELSYDDLLLIGMLLERDQDLLRKFKKNEQILKDLHGKRILILPGDLKPERETSTSN